MDQAIQPFQNAVVDPGGEPTQDAVPMPLNGGCGLFHGIQSTVRGPEIPFLQERLPVPLAAQTVPENSASGGRHGLF